MDNRPSSSTTLLLHLLILSWSVRVAQSDIPWSVFTQRKIPCSTLAQSDICRSALAQSRIPRSSLAQKDIPWSVFTQGHMKLELRGGRGAVDQLAPLVRVSRVPHATLARGDAEAKGGVRLQGGERVALDLCNGRGCG